MPIEPFELYLDRGTKSYAEPAYEDPIAAMADKLNEVIEAVNTRPVIADCGCWRQGDNWHRCVSHTRSPSSVGELAELYNAESERLRRNTLLPPSDKSVV